ncbi:MAG: hypothetical protein AAF467_26135 [Actinomycetota bacterium]
MTSTSIEQRLARLGTHLDDERLGRAPRTALDATDAATDAPAFLGRKRPRAGARMVGVAVAVVAGVIMAGVALGVRPSTDVVETAGTVSPTPAAEVPVGAPAPGTVAPFVGTPPAWFGEPRAAERAAGHHTGNWVSTAIGIDDGQGGYRSPIRIGVTDGSLRDLDATVPSTIDGRTVRLLDYGTDWQAVATTGSPTVVVGGAVELELLLDVLDATEVFDGADTGLTVELTTPPDRYTTIVEPQRHALDSPNRRALAGAGGDIVINEVSEWVRADLAAATSGADIRPIAVGDVIGYVGTADASTVGPVTFLVWSPEPGVVLEIDTTNPSLQAEDLAALAVAVQLLPVDEWDLALDAPTG